MRFSNPVLTAAPIAQSMRRPGSQTCACSRKRRRTRWQKRVPRPFANRLGPDDIALVYYAGHGFQIGGRNYLVTADGETLIALDEVMKQLTARAKGTIMIVDACRENPLAAVPASLTVRSVGATRAIETVRMTDIEWKSKGLAQLGDLRGLSAIVLFSTEPGNVALDGDEGRGSPFAKQAARELARRQSLDSAFRRIAVAVNKATGGQQSPWRQGDLPFDVYLAGMADFPVP